MITEADRFVEFVCASNQSSDVWTQALTQAAKLYHEVAKLNNDIALDLKAFNCLLQ